MATPEYIWQDRDIKFDSNPSLLTCRKGEVLIDSINSVEDTKGSNGERGSLTVTNLRLIWIAHENTRVNLSIGYSCIQTISIRKAKSKLRGFTQALSVVAKHNSRYEFVFTSLVKNSPRLFTTVQAVHKAYESSKLYRDLKLRGSIIHEGELILLPHEEIFNQVPGVWNLSSDQIKNIRLRESKFGQALVIETFTRAGGYILGFRIDPLELLQATLKEITNLFSIFSSSPIFGVDFVVESDTPAANETITPRRVEEDVELIEEDEDAHAVAAYYADGGGADEGMEGGRIDFDSRLGLAIEALQPGLTMEQLWRVV